MEVIKASRLVCPSEYYIGRCCALDEISYSVTENELLCVLGAADAGKSALIKTITGLMPLEKGELCIYGMDCSKEENRREIRKKCATVFEKAEELYISTSVQNELAFAAKNFGIAEEELEKRISDALSAVGLEDCMDGYVPLLCAYERYCLAIAAALVYAPDMIILDSVAEGFEEAEREKIFRLLNELHKAGKTVIYTSRDPQDAVMADRVLLLKEGQVLAEGSPREVLTDAGLLTSAGVELPFTLRISMDLAEAGAGLSKCPLDIDELVDEICL